MTSPRGSYFAKNKSKLLNLQNGHTEKFFYHPFLTILKPLERSEIMFSHQKSVKKPFFYMTCPRGSFFAKVGVSCQTFKMDIQRSCFHPPFLTILKPWERSESMFSHQNSVKKPFFPNGPTRGLYYCSMFTCFLLHFLFFLS